MSQHNVKAIIENKPFDMPVTVANSALLFNRGLDSHNSVMLTPLVRAPLSKKTVINLCLHDEAVTLGVISVSIYSHRTFRDSTHLDEESKECYI